MTGKRETKKQAVRERLFDAAVTLFETHGYDAVSIDRIVEEAGVAKGTFFNHFPTKDHLLFEWYARATAQAESVEPPPGRLADRLPHVPYILGVVGSFAVAVVAIARLLERLGGGSTGRGEQGADTRER